MAGIGQLNVRHANARYGVTPIAAKSDVLRRRTGACFQPFPNPLGTTRVLHDRLVCRADEPGDPRQ